MIDSNAVSVVVLSTGRPSSWDGQGLKHSGGLFWIDCTVPSRTARPPPLAVHWKDFGLRSKDEYGTRQDLLYDLAQIIGACAWQLLSNTLILQSLNSAECLLAASALGFAWRSLLFIFLHVFRTLTDTRQAEQCRRKPWHCPRFLWDTKKKLQGWKSSLWCHITRTLGQSEVHQEHLRREFSDRRVNLDPSMWNSSAGTWGTRVMAESDSRGSIRFEPKVQENLALSLTSEE